MPALHRMIATELLRERLVEGSPDPLRLALTQLLKPMRSAARDELINRGALLARAVRGRPVTARGRCPARPPGHRPTRHPAKTPEYYLRRASTGDGAWEPVAPGGYADALIADIRRMLLEKLSNGVPIADVTELDREIRRHEEEYGPLVVVLHDPPDPALGERLNAEFPRVAFVYVTPGGETAYDGVPLFGLSPAQEVALIRLGTKLHSRFP
ncbi:hypothetical protein [Paractinoplanes toevensis]|uniref:Uncharacterized protein n=1 Tax=Paractinoplanes toevensis TaxID=571911 RepID=A0A919T6T7_9ACTN|nr:hypothetical protein [Actinoplanes toevensis]GIM90090.1 hypothetical protein Ato02nite_018830 [Actinoplanes toevensis]